LEPEAAFAAAQALAVAQGEALAISPRTLRRRLKERGLLASTDAGRGVLTVRRVLEGKRREVLHLLATSLLSEPDQPDHSPENAGENGRVPGRVAGRDSPDPTADPTTEPDQNTEGNGRVVGLVGSDAGREAPARGISPAYLAPGETVESTRVPWDEDGAPGEGH
jgi:hypothetical protein